MSPDRKRFLLALFFASAPLLFFWSTGIFDFDEGIYAAVVSEMSQSGNWLIPTYQGEPWFEKPILIYWLAGVAIEVLGPTLGPRFASVACSIGVLALCGSFAMKRCGEACGRLTMWILGGSLLFAVVGNLLLADGPMVFFLTAALLGWIDWLQGRSKSLWLAGVALGLALLAKGPFVVIVFVISAVWTSIAERAPASPPRSAWIVFFFATLATAATWYVPAYLQNPHQFVDSFVLQQNVGRLMGGDVAHRTPWFLFPIYYVIVLGIGFAPWLFLAFRYWPRKASNDGTFEFERRALARFVVVVFVIFTASGSKLPHYILPVLPACSIMLALGIVSDHESAGRRYLRWALGMVAFCLAVNLYLFPKYYELSGQRQAHEIVQFVRDSGEPLHSYRIRPPMRDPSIKTELQETTLPSLAFYFGRAIPDHISVTSLESLDTPYYLLTRDGRLEGKELDRLRSGLRLVRINEFSDETSARLNTGRFELFRVERY